MVDDTTPATTWAWLDEATRHLVTLSLVGALTYGFIIGKVNADAFLGLTGITIGFWFKNGRK